MYFEQSGVDNPPLHALANGVDGQNGVYLYTTSGGFPSFSSLFSNYWVDVVFTSSNTYNISGALSGYGGSGATVTLSGATSSSTTADGSGNYGFNGLVNGSYTITPTNSGVTFTPASQTVTINGGVVTGVNFTAVVSNPLSISGTITGGAGATVSLGGSVVATTTADASGNYAFNGLLNGTFSVTPLQTGLIFTPGTQTVVLSGSSVPGVNFQGQVCDCISIWQPSAIPSVIDSSDGTPVELGVKFRVDTAGFVTALRFYKAATNVGTHVGHIWTSSGASLGSATFTSETASGWQQVTFATPILLAANTTYIASYFAPSGHYSVDSNFFATKGADNPPLHALATGVDGSNGVFAYTTNSPTFPSNSFNSSNYWVDVLFSPLQPHGLSGNIAGTNGPGATVSLNNGTTTVTTTADASGNYAFSNVYDGTYSVTPSKNAIIFAPGNQNVTVSGADLTGVNFTTLAICPCNTIWQGTVQPGTIDSGDAHPVELGVKFRADSDGYIVGVRYYKSSANTGTHVGNLWTTSGTLLATAQFSNEGASGWQQVIFANPVPVTANTTYVASYFAPIGHYSADSAFFATAGVDTPPLHALATGVDQDGVYAYSSASLFPNNSYNATNYWVDVIFATTSAHTLSGVVTGPAAATTTLVLSGTSSATTTTDSSGNYSFAGLADGTYVVTPSAAGVLFTPPSQTVTISGAHKPGINFTSAVPTFSVSGTVTNGPAVAVTLTGSTTLTTVTDASGNYSFGVPNGSYVVTPSGVGLAFSPVSQSVSVNGANVGGVNFTTTVLTYAISGTISGGAGATVSISGTTAASTVADASGNYSIAGLANGTYTIIPSLVGSVFTPTSMNAVVANANVTAANFTVPPNCPCNTIWQPGNAPIVADNGESAAIELGVKFRTDSGGYISGIRFYKAALNTGIHTGELWSSDGTLLATATFASEGSSGWQQVFFTSPVPVQANTTYIASYFTPTGHYSSDFNFFASSGVDSVPLHALASGVDGTNGVYLYAASGGFPINSFNATNYWVDVVFTPTTTSSITGTISGPGGAGATVSLSGAATATVVASAAGTFTFTGVADGSYTVTPNNAGYAFTPASQAVTVAGANATANFATVSYTVSGTISGTGGSGATVSLTGAATATTTADASGNYSFTGLANGAYTVTPSKAGFTFTPASAAVTVSGANATANFATQLFTISGTISGTGGSGATVSLTGAATATTTADASGNYSFAGVANGAYTVTPSKAGFTFTPASAAVTVSGANATASFATQTFTISGTISGTGGNAATVKLTGAATATVTASSTGAYSFTGLANGAYTVTPSKTGFTFTPASAAVTVSGANATANFATQTFTISGTISGTGGNAATVRLTGAATATVTASSTGAYSFTGLANGSYTVTPSKTGFTFTPASAAVTISGANATANFATQTFTISGTISGTGGNAATVRLTGAATATVTASSTGAYSFTGLTNGSYTVTPSKAGFTFTPASTAVTINSANATANFATQTFTISGTISGTGGNAATVRLTGAATATVTASSTGAYSFTGLTNGSYTVTPSKAGFTFTPASTAVTINSANATANFATQTFTISGTISGAGGNAATVRLTGAATATVTASSTGAYSFTGLANGSYTVTPSKTGYAFTPTNRAVTISGANATANFATQTFTISGTISGVGISGVTVRLTGSATATATSSILGTYSFTGLTNGTYTITPSKTGRVYTPASRTTGLTTSNVTGMNFTAN